MPALRVASAPTDAHLAARAVDGDSDAYGMLVHRHQGAIYRYARGMGLDHDTSLDLVQEAFIRGWERLAECRDGAHYRSWIFRICRNLCLDHLRNVRRRTVSMSDFDDVEAIEDPRQGGDDVTLVLRAALAGIPDAMREAFLLKHDAGYTYDEIAVITDASPSAVKMRVHRAREALHSFLARQGVVSAEIA